MTPSIIVRFDFSAEYPIHWQVLTLDNVPQCHQTDLKGFNDWLQEQSERCNVYLLLPIEQFSFHYLEVPDAVKRSAKQLAPVLMEEQLAEDIDRVLVQYVQSDQFEVNVAVCNKQWLEQLVACFKTDKTCLKACLPEAVCADLPDIYYEAQSLLTAAPSLSTSVKLDVPESLTLSRPETQQFLSGLTYSPWNLISPEASEGNPLYILLIMLLLNLGLYLLNLD